ncbi:unnamed protein product [Adineta steineri]|uniref:F-box domain-containing protein n=1 Tax=Adineta steineri TaxID=433720 RepID=A0A813SDK1_9BILA|nr:unnamed protein product [Adineta steineri]CAF0794778.1 unnamed protein product [Adineta steineri]
MSVSKLEQLANEIMYTIFDYLDGFHLIFAFRGLNSRFTSLINHMLLHINTRYCRKVDFNYFFDSIFPFTTNVFSLTISNTNHLGPIEIFIKRYLDLIPHNQLNHLKFIDIDQEALNIFLKTVFSKLTQLVSLNITSSLTEFRYNSVREIMNVSLPAFKYLSLSIKQYSYYPFAPIFNKYMLIHRMESILSTVTHLSLGYSPQDITRLIDIFDKLNKIEYFQITLDIDDEIACAIGGPFIFNSQLIRDQGQHLRSFIIQIGYHILFAEIASLLTHFPQLQILSLATSVFTRDIQFYDGQQQEQLIQTSLLRLTSFRLYIFADNLSSGPILHDIINRFRTSFWLNEKNAWDNTLPSLNLSTFDCITRLKLYITNVKSIKISAWPKRITEPKLCFICNDDNNERSECFQPNNSSCNNNGQIKCAMSHPMERCYSKTVQLLGRAARVQRGTQLTTECYNYINDCDTSYIAGQAYSKECCCNEHYCNAR